MLDAIGVSNPYRLKSPFWLDQSSYIGVQQLLILQHVNTHVSGGY